MRAARVAMSIHSPAKAKMMAIRPAMAPAVVRVWRFGVLKGRMGASQVRRFFSGSGGIGLIYHKCGLK